MINDKIHLMLFSQNNLPFLFYDIQIQYFRRKHCKIPEHKVVFYNHYFTLGVPIDNCKTQHN